MRQPIIKDLYEYEVTKNEGEGIKGYGWNLDVYKNGEKVLSDGAYGSELMAYFSARNFFLLSEFDISSDDREGQMNERFNKRGSLDTPNLDYKMLSEAKLNKKALENRVDVNYKGKLYLIEYYEEGGHNQYSFIVEELDEETHEAVKEIYFTSDLAEITGLFEDGFMEWHRPEKFIEYLDQMGKLGNIENNKTEEWEVFDYDIWGNREDGYEVNDIHRAGLVTLPENADLKKIIEVLVEDGILAESAGTGNIEEDTNHGDDMIIYLIESDDGRPLLELRRKEPSAIDKEEEEKNRKIKEEEEEKTRKIKEWEKQWTKGSNVIEKITVEAEGLIL